MALDPFLADVRRRLLSKPSFPSLGVDGARAAVRAGRAFLGEGPSMFRTEDLALATRDGAIRGRLHWPTSKPRGLIVYVHGGGWVIGEIEDFDAVAKTLAAATNCAILLPQYRLAPEHRFPAALHDVIDVLALAANEMRRFAGVYKPLVVLGDSAGANLATVAVRHLHHRVRFALQVLAYPVTDCDFSTKSYLAHGNEPPLTQADMRWFFDKYAPPDLWMNEDISPLRSPHLGHLPRSVVLVCEVDVLRDEGLAYAEALAQGGTDVTVRLVHGATHGFLPFVNRLDLARTELGLIAEEISRSR